MNYTPCPIDTDHVQLNDDLIQLTEIIAKQVHILKKRRRCSMSNNQLELIRRYCDTTGTRLKNTEKDLLCIYNFDITYC